MMRLANVVLLLLMAPLLAVGQNSEVGIGLGTFNYTGDLARKYDFRNSKFAGTAFYRSNMSKVVSFRAALTAGKIGATDSRPFDAFAERRNASFNLFLYEVSTGFEYHFLNWRDDKHLLRFTPYMFGGLGIFGMSGARQKEEQYSNIQGCVPFGVGFKYVINPLWYISAEFGARKLFFDYLDNISVGNPRVKNYQYGNPNDNDMYYFLGVTVTRTFYVIPCPTNPYK